MRLSDCFVDWFSWLIGWSGRSCWVDWLVVWLRWLVGLVDWVDWVGWLSRWLGEVGESGLVSLGLVKIFFDLPWFGQVSSVLRVWFSAVWSCLVLHSFKLI